MNNQYVDHTQIKKEIFTIFDLETTGLDPFNGDQIIEIAALKTDLERDYGMFHTFVKLNQGKEIPEVIKNLTGITEEDTKYGISDVRAVHLLYKFVLGTTAVAHHFPFDASFIKETSKMSTPSSFICTRVLVKLVEPGQSASLADVTKRIGYDLTGHHRAFNDVMATKAVLKHYLPLAKEKGIEYRNVVINDQERPLNFIPDYAKVINK